MGNGSRRNEKESGTGESLVAGASDVAPAEEDQLMSTQQLCEMIADISETVLENPEESFGSISGTSKMAQLLSVARHSDEYVARLAVISLLAIFKDILPSYRIRLPTEQERAVQVSRETKRTWEYERSLLGAYQQYLQLLEKKWDQAKSGKTPTPLQVTCMLSLCELLSTAYNFNFRSNLLTAVVRQMNTGISSVVSEACCAAVETVFREDAQGHIADEAAKLVSKLIRNAPFVKPAVIRTFASLPLKVHADETAAAKLLEQSKKKRRRKDKDAAGIEAELKESAGVDKAILARNQSSTLQSVVLSYFRILKDCQNGELKSSMDETLSAALEGLAKFAHLINIDTVIDLLALLRELLRDADSLPLDAALNCILTVFQTLQGPGRELKIDIKEYIIPLYTQLQRLRFYADSEKGSQRTSSTTLMLKCLDLALCKRREFSTTRVAAFFRQILIVAMHAPPATSVPLLSFARILLQRYEGIQPLLENDDDVVISCGDHNPNVQDPEYSNPFSTPAWELALLSFHFRQDIRHQSKSAASLKMLQLPSEGPDRLRNDNLEDEKNLTIEYVRVKKKHPLEHTKSKQGKSSVRFVTPRIKRLRLLPEDE